ncbi:uncharacterized protein SOCE26_061750 [Sorangium cellulosum]|uniref:Uncharacterized protein n=1 Tax=Sorangium cellulosum TaxID=56 RepID=A0A2L0EZH0_SORCE|nr:uncharacterized protein SOCE26_061750 [Sorangium cellulosum]
MQTCSWRLSWRPVSSKTWADAAMLPSTQGSRASVNLASERRGNPLHAFNAAQNSRKISAGLRSLGVNRRTCHSEAKCAEARIFLLSVSHTARVSLQSGEAFAVRSPRLGCARRRSSRRRSPGDRGARGRRLKRGRGMDELLCGRARAAANGADRAPGEARQATWATRSYRIPASGLGYSLRETPQEGAIFGLLRARRLTADGSPWSKSGRERVRTDECLARLAAGEHQSYTCRSCPVQGRVRSHAADAGFGQGCSCITHRARVLLYHPSNPKT